MTPEPEDQPPRRSIFAPWRWSKQTWLWMLWLSPVWYALSSGPILAIAGRIVYYTGLNGIFWMLLLFYSPLYLILPDEMVRGYFTWWTALLNPSR